MNFFIVLKLQSGETKVCSFSGPRIGVTGPLGYCAAGGLSARMPGAAASSRTVSIVILPRSERGTAAEFLRARDAVRRCGQTAVRRRQQGRNTS
jgi:hypothetical protein